jgi:ATP-dependent DNA ligase
LITYADLAQLSTAPAPFNRAGWVFELKYDGFRMFAAHRRDRAELVSRNGTDFASRFQEIAGELLELPDVVVDGELVILDGEGRPQFDRLSRRARRSRPVAIEHGSRMDPAVLFVFDLLELDGEDVRAQRLIERKALLKSVLDGGDRVRYTSHIHDDGLMLFKVAEQLELEGIVGKRAPTRHIRARPAARAIG